MQKFLFYRPTYPIFSWTVTGNKLYFFLGLKIFFLRFTYIVSWTERGIFYSFRGEAYQEHTKCISEEEKYSGKNFKPKANANKGEAKQEAWIEVNNEIIALDITLIMSLLFGAIVFASRVPWHLLDT